MSLDARARRAGDAVRRATEDRTPRLSPRRLERGHRARRALRATISVAALAVAAAVGALLAPLERRPAGPGGPVRVAVEGLPGPIAADGASVWVASLDGTLTRIDPASFRVVTRVDPPGRWTPVKVLLTDDALWVSGPPGGVRLGQPFLIARLDPRTGDLLRTYEAGRFVDFDILEGTAWTIDEGGGLEKMNLRTGRTVRVARIPSTPSRLVATPRKIWVSVPRDRALFAFEVDGRGLERIPAGQSPSAMAVLGDSVWVADQRTPTLSRIEADSGRLAATLELRHPARSVLAVDDRIWAVDHIGGRFSVIDPTTGTILVTRDAGRRFQAAAAARGGLWTSDTVAGEVRRLSL